MTETMQAEVLDAIPLTPIELIRFNTLNKLGNPDNVLKVDVKPISGHSYRVNVWTKDGDGLVRAGKITYSEIVTVLDGD